MDNPLVGNIEFTDRRRNRLSREEIQEIAREIVTYQVHTCRFPGVSPDELESAMRFYKHVDSMMAETGSTIRKTFVVFGITGVLSLLVLGVYSKIRTSLGI